MQAQRARTGALALIAALSLAITGCSSSSSKTSGSSSKNEPSTSGAAGSPSTPAAPTAASGCSAADTAGAKLNLWYVNVLTSYPAWAASMKKFENEAAACNYKATGVGPSKLDTVANVNEMNQAIADKADGIIFCDTDPTTFKSEVDKARAAGIVTVTLGCVDTISDYSIGTDNALFGSSAADVIASKVGPKAQVGIVSTDRTTPNQVAQVNAFKAQIKAKYPTMKVVAWESDNSDTATAAQKITAMTEANSGMNAVWCVEGNCPGGVQAGLSAAGKKAGQVFALGIDNVDTTIAALKAGWLGASLNQCYFDATTLATQLIRDKKAGHANPKQSWGIPVDTITKDNLPYKGCPSSAIPTIK